MVLLRRDKVGENFFESGEESWVRLIVSTLLRVEQTCCFASFMWPFAVAMLLGRYFEIKSAVKVGQEEKLPFLMDLMKVLGTGDKTARW